MLDRFPVFDPSRFRLPIKSFFVADAEKSESQNLNQSNELMAKLLKADACQIIICGIHGGFIIIWSAITIVLAQVSPSKDGGNVEGQCASDVGAIIVC